jgi:hypothetical protein
MKTSLLFVFLVACLVQPSAAQQQGADVNEIGNFVGKTVQISGVLRAVIRPTRLHNKIVVLVDDDMLPQEPLRIIMMYARFSPALYRSLDSSKGREVLINAKIERHNGKLAAINYERKPDITTIIPVDSYTGKASTAIIRTKKIFVR